MPEIVERDGEYCLEGYGDADKCYASEEAAQAAVKKLAVSEDKALAFSAFPNWLTAPTEGVEKALAERIWDGIKERLGWKDSDEATGFKVFRQSDGRYRWSAWYSNNFEDREREFFREKGFDRYVKRLDIGAVDMPELWAWHTKGTRGGVADWVDRVGHFHIATGLYDDTPMGKATALYDLKHQKDYGVSHGFLYRLSDVEVVDGKKVYNDWNTFEISPLPLHRAANELTAFAVELSEGIKAIEMDAEKRKHLVEKYADLGGETYVANLEKMTEQRGKDAEALKGFKDFVHPGNDTNGANEGNKEALGAANKAFGEFMPQLVEDAGEAVTAALAAVKAAKAADAKYADAMQQIDALRAEMQLRPRAASKAAETEVETSHLSETLQKALKEQNTVRDSFWGTEVVK